MLRSENEIVFPFEKCIIFTVVPFVDYFVTFRDRTI